MVERQRGPRAATSKHHPLCCLHCPCTQVWKLGEEMDGDNVKNGDVGPGVAPGNGGGDDDFPDERRKPWTQVEELAGFLELLHRPDDKTAEETDSRPGYKRDACEREIA